jgi:hypothetical protein
MFSFEGIATSTQPALPISLEDGSDALVVSHLIKDVLDRVFNNWQDRASFVHSSELKPDENPENLTFVELFVTHNLLYEYSSPPPHLQRFVIRRDIHGEPIWQGDNLRDAVVQLLYEDAKSAISEAWQQFTH